jgi:hypothetical protein
MTLTGIFITMWLCGGVTVAGDGTAVKFLEIAIFGSLSIWGLRRCFYAAKG